ncbi:MAG: metal-dependent hydrolase [Sphingobium sp.]
MDNLTHSMLGAVLGQTGLKRKSGLGMPALVIGANIPDVDATCTFFGTQSLAMRRGLTHGPLAMVLLPVILTGLLFLYDRWQGKHGRRPENRLPVRPGWLLLLALIGTLSHPAMDWMNSYGVRLLEPFSSRWFYGDVLFIIDPVLWVLMIGGYIWSRRAEKRGDGDWRQRGRVILTAVCGYIFVNGAITGAAEAQAVRRLHDNGMETDLVVANPVPGTFWRRDMLWRARDGRYGHYGYDLFSGIRPFEIDGKTGMDNRMIASRVAASADARAFLFWSRMPIATFDRAGTLTLSDQRFSARLTRGSFVVTVPSEIGR